MRRLQRLVVERRSIAGDETRRYDRGMPRITMHDVARRAGVSQPLVSLVIGGSTSVRVAEATRERILRAAAELGYRPNVIARALVQSRSYSLGIIIPDLYNPFFVDVVSGVDRVATEEGYAVLLCSGGESRGESLLLPERIRRHLRIPFVTPACPARRAEKRSAVRPTT